MTKNDPSLNELEKRLTESERQYVSPNSRPRDASTLILLDYRAGVPHVLMGRRDRSLKFMPGKFVFPGGRIDTADRRAPFVNDLTAPDRDRLLTDMKGKPSESRARALALTAIRETYEETGILLGQSGQKERFPKGDWEGFANHSVVPDLSALTFIARAITPPRRPRRFDTRFFAATTDAIGHQMPFEQRPHLELGELQWIPMDEASSLELPSVTSVIIDELADRLKADGGLTPKAPVPYYQMRQKIFRRNEI